MFNFYIIAVFTSANNYSECQCNIVIMKVVKVLCCEMKNAVYCFERCYMIYEQLWIYSLIIYIIMNIQYVSGGGIGLQNIQKWGE